MQEPIYVDPPSEHPEMKYIDVNGRQEHNERPEVEYIDVNGRQEHEDIIRNSEKCAELGIDQYYEIIVYLKRWGGWLHENKPS
jgi:hypothetical protein